MFKFCAGREFARPLNSQEDSEHLSQVFDGYRSNLVFELFNRHIEKLSHNLGPGDEVQSPDELIEGLHICVEFLSFIRSYQDQFRLSISDRKVYSKWTFSYERAINHPSCHLLVNISKTCKSINEYLQQVPDELLEMVEQEDKFKHLDVNLSAIKKAPKKGAFVYGGC